MEKENKIKVYTTSSGAELSISAPSTKQVISATNNRAQYYAELAKKYRDEAKLHRDNAKYYAEQNSNVTFEYVTNVRASLEEKINEKQPLGDYALREEVPVNVSELVNDSEYINITELENAIDEVRLPSQDGCEDMFLCSDGKEAYWRKPGIKGFELFDTKISDHILSWEESAGWALQGTYVYKEAVAGERLGYPDFYEKCIEEKEAGTATETVLGNNTITIYINANGHQFYDISNKEAVDLWFETYGIADFYGVDLENERIFLPRNNKFVQLTADAESVNKMNKAGLPNHKHYEFVSTSRGTSVDSKTAQQLTNSNQVSSLWYSGYAAYNMARNSEAANVGLSSYAIGDLYGQSNTVQPPSSNKLLYYCVGNTIANTSWVDTIKQVENGVKDLEDKKNLCIEEINASAKGFDNLTERQITNCLLEVPQRIKYSLEDGILTIKAGSVVIVPYGVEDLTTNYPEGSTFLNDNFKVVDTQYTDGKFFVWVEVLSDTVKQGTVTDTSIRSLIVNITDNILQIYVNNGSGTESYTGTENYLGYRTDLNIVERYISGVLQNTVQALPIMRVAADGTNLCGSVKQVFNGFGYIGSTIWADKGVKGLIPDGRNADGSLKNKEYTTSALSLYTSNDNGNKYLVLSEDYNGIRIFTNNIYDKETNYNRDGQGNIQVCLRLGTVTVTNGVVSNFLPKQVFMARDYNDISIKETYQNGKSWYRLWSDGWCEQGGFISIANNSDAVITFLKPFANTNYTVTLGQISSDPTYYYYNHIGSTTKTNATIILTNRRFNSSNTYSLSVDWRACGYSPL